MKIKALKSILTVSPEKFWKEGEVLDLPEELAKQLLSNPNFVKVEELRKSSEIKIRKKKIK
jgi:hypothetical protein